MARLIIECANTGETVEAFDIDLDLITNTDLIESILEQQVFGDKYSQLVREYRTMIINKNNIPIMEIATLSSLGFIDGDIIRLITRPM